MFQSRRRSTLNSNGYTLLEALFQLVVLVIFAQFLVLVYLWISQFNNSLSTNESISWELFVIDLQQYLIKIEEISILDQNRGIVIKQEHVSETIQISQISDVLRLQKDNKGHIPMLIGIKNSSFSMSGNDLIINVELQNGEVKERTFIVSFAQE